VNTEEINGTYAQKFGENDTLLQGHYDGVQRDFDLTDDERAGQAIEGQERASVYLHQLEEWRSAALAEREADLRDDLFSAATVNGFDGSVVKEDANAAQLATIDAPDEKLQVMASRAASTKNTTLAKAVAAEADARIRPDIAMAALKWLPQKLEAYLELVDIPDAEERAARLDRTQTSIPLPNMIRLRPTAEMLAVRGRVDAAKRAQRAGIWD
jgi:hypothetical protein